MTAARALRLVDPDTGELLESHGTCAHCDYLEGQLAGAERENRAWRTRYQNLARDKDAEAREHELWPQAVQVFEYWRRECKHPRSEWTADRFFVVLPFVKQYGVEPCLRAIAGAAYDPFVTTRRNGSKERHDGWELIFRSTGKFESFANKAPRGWAPPA